MLITWALAAWVVAVSAQEETGISTGLFSVEGELIFPPEALTSSKWHSQSRILLNHGEHIGFVKADGHFRVDGVPPGSYVVQVENVDYMFEPVRVDMTAKGKIRARKLSVIQPTQVNQISYPLKMSAREQTRYFRKREEWRVTDFLFSPTVLMLGVPMLLLFIMPKIAASDPEMQKEMENMQMPKVDMPDVGEMMANFFGGGPSKKKKAISGSGAASAAQRRK